MYSASILLASCLARVVLPVPGVPVITTTFRVIALAKASLSLFRPYLSLSVVQVFPYPFFDLLVEFGIWDHPWIFDAILCEMVGDKCEKPFVFRIDILGVSLKHSYNASAYLSEVRVEFRQFGTHQKEELQLSYLKTRLSAS